MTVPSSQHGTGSVLRCVLALVAVLVSSLCAAGPSAAESVRAEPASAAVDALPAAGLPVGKVGAARAGTDLRAVDAPHEAVDSSSSGTGHCDGQATPDTAAARDGSRASAPLPTPQREEHRTPAATTGPGPAPAGPGSAPPAPDPVRLSVLRI
ncbi:hypothetical protein [Streptomyces chumphonensis]|uniref:hypothetical protein n=1 Tax=Streptomyces chumphonensis TaxID=1214925 RepID=UPI003D75824B